MVPDVVLEGVIEGVRIVLYMGRNGHVLNKVHDPAKVIEDFIFVIRGKIAETVCETDPLDQVIEKHVGPIESGRAHAEKTRIGCGIVKMFKKIAPAVGAGGRVIVKREERIFIVGTGAEVREGLFRFI